MGMREHHKNIPVENGILEALSGPQETCKQHLILEEK